MTRQRAAWIGGSIAVFLTVFAATVVLIARSAWFAGQVRGGIVTAVERATGGRAELGEFSFDWSRLRAEIRGFTLHGTEPEGKPPLLRAASAAVGLKIISVLEKKVDIEYLEVIAPRAYLIVGPDGSTNIPAPKVRTQGKNAAETVLDLAIGRLRVSGGLFEIETRGSVPWDAQARNLEAKLVYEAAGPRYRGNIEAQPLDVNVDGYVPVAAGLALAVTVERNRIDIDSARLTTGQTEIQASGAIEDLLAPHGSFRYHVRADQSDVGRFLSTHLLESGVAEVDGSAVWQGGSNFHLTGDLHAYRLTYIHPNVELRNFRADGTVTAGPDGIDITGMRLSGTYSPGVSYTTAPRTAPVPVDARIADAAIRGTLIDFRNVALSVLGGTFDGNAQLWALDRFHVKGDVTGFQARRVVAIYSAEPLPWDGRASGPLEVEGTAQTLPYAHVQAELVLEPEQGGAPVHGQLAAAYDTRTEIWDLGRSTLTLPSSRAEFSGAIGKTLRAHVETRDLNDLLPAFGVSAAEFPVRLDGGSALLDATVTGPPGEERIAGTLNASSFTYAGNHLDSLSADVAASSTNIKFDRGTLAVGGLRARFDGAVALSGWATRPESDIFGSATLQNAPAAELAGWAGWSGPAVSGQLNVSAQFSGTVGKSILLSQVEALRGTLAGEPFDRFSGYLTYSGRRLELSSGVITAGRKELRVSAQYSHAADRFDAGALRFSAAARAMPLEDVHTLTGARPGIKGSIQANIAGTVNVTPAPPGARGFEIAELHADIAAQGLELDGQQLGAARFTADTQGRDLRVRLDSDFADSSVQGSGSWRLEGDYPGSARVEFSQLDLARLRTWFSPGAGGALPAYTGYAEGSIAIEGPILKPETWKAELTVPKFEFAAAITGEPAGAGAPPLTVRNDGPIRASMANSVITIDSARLVGRSTDLTIAGKIAVDQANPFDLRVNGNLDLGILRDFYPDLTATGSAVANATLHGTSENPQFGGRIEIRNAALSLVDFPNGISNGNGVLVFTNDRATIQSLTAESGGGKIDLSGFVGYSSGQAIFRLYAALREVRVRYPEGVSTVANASLNLTGTSERSMLAGTVTVLRTGFNPQSDFGSMLASSSQPVETASVRTGPFGGMNFDIQIQTAPDILVQSSLTQGLGVESKNLRLRGTVANPALAGRIDITQGQVVFFGTRYDISQGSISFFNLVRIEPVVNLDLETKARGIDVTLTISGPLGKLNLTPRSDPPLQFNEIVALLATGEAPATGNTYSTSQQGASATQFGAQQNGASALLGQAIANPVSGRLQRFFGVSRLRIDPTLQGVEYSPQARITVEQQVTPSITFTYISVLNTSNPQVVSMQWDVSKQWSMSAVREQNGVFGLDFFVKRQFR